MASDNIYPETFKICQLESPLLYRDYIKLYAHQPKIIQVLKCNIIIIWFIT